MHNIKIQQNMAQDTDDVRRVHLTALGSDI
jgi:hypothetical protein